MSKRVVRHWTQEERDFLEEKWGTMSVGGLAKRLNRSAGSILAQVHRLKLGSICEAAGMITRSQLCLLLFSRSSWRREASRKRYELMQSIPVIKKLGNRKRYLFIDLDQFWKWAEEHKDDIQWNRLEPLILGKEPEWVAEMRKKQFPTFQKRYRDVSDSEMWQLESLLKKGIPLKEIAEIMDRPISTIQRRATTFRIINKPWTDEEKKMLVELHVQGYSFEQIAKCLNRTVLATKKRLCSCGVKRKPGRPKKVKSDV